MTLILASASPRRRELLGQAGIAHDVIPASVDESELPGQTPAAHVARLAAAKA
jgi:septum formation protein